MRRAYIVSLVERAGLSLMPISAWLLIRLGEDPGSVVQTGCPSIDIADARWPPLYAIGAATAAALDAAGHPGAAVPEEPASSETLLALEGLQQIDGQRFLLITGENGRELIAPTLQARGATVDTLTLYRRRPVEHEAERIESELAIADAIVITSGQTLDRLWALTPEPMRPLLRALTQELTEDASTDLTVLRGEPVGGPGNERREVPDGETLLEVLRVSRQRLDALALGLAQRAHLLVRLTHRGRGVRRARSPRPRHRSDDSCYNVA